MCVCVWGGGGEGKGRCDERTENRGQTYITTCVKDRVIIHFMMFKNTNMTAFSHINNMYI